MTTCKHCGKGIKFDAFIRKWVSGYSPPTMYSKTKKGTWKCGNDPAFPVRAHAPDEEVRTYPDPDGRDFDNLGESPDY